MSQSKLNTYNSVHPRTVVVDTVAESMNGVKDEHEVDAIIDSTLSSTEAAIRNNYPLADFEEYKQSL